MQHPFTIYTNRCFLTASSLHASTGVVEAHASMENRRNLPGLKTFMGFYVSTMKAGIGLPILPNSTCIGKSSVTGTHINKSKDCKKSLALLQ
jgi:hypothetical protein